jgi:hypothetical protein
MKYLSPLLSDARASIGGATASKNRGGNYFRARVAPIQPRTENQQFIRAQLSSLSASWRGLTVTKQSGWNSLASGITLKDSLGQSYKPTGAQLYTGNNMNLFLLGSPTVTVAPPSRPDFPDFANVNAITTAGTPAFTVTTGSAAAPTGYLFRVNATPQMSPGISYIGKSRYRFVEGFPASAFASLDILDEWNALFGTLVAGQLIGVTVALVDIATGFASTQASTTVIIAA